MKRTALSIAILSIGSLLPKLALAESEFAGPPPSHDDGRYTPAMSSPPPDVIAQPCDDDEPCGRRILLRSPVRFELGPALVTTGDGAGYGLATGFSFGEKSFGVRLGAMWLKGEERASVPNAATGESMQAYSAETTLDLNKRGPFHPVVAMGLALGRVKHPTDSGWFGAGTARVALEYAMNLDRTDVRFGVGATGAMVGLRDDAVKNLSAYAVIDAKCVIGF